MKKRNTLVKTLLTAALSLCALTATATATEDTTDFIVTGGTGYTQTADVLTITQDGTYTIGMAEGLTTTADTIKVADTVDSVTLIFDDVTIDKDDTNDTGGNIYGIYSLADTTTLQGTLHVSATVTATDAEADEGNAYSIYCENGDIVIENGADITVTAESSAASAYGISASNATITDSTVTATADTTNDTSSADTTNDTSSAYGISASSNATIEGSTITTTVNIDATDTSSNSKASGIRAGTVTINNHSTITATTATKSGYSYAIYAYAKDVAIAESTVVATAASDSTAYGIYASDGVDIADNATCTVTVTASGQASGIYADTEAVTIADSTITVAATSNSDAAIASGIYADSDAITITDSTITVTATSSSAAAIASGIYADSDAITITDSTITATAENGSGQAYSMYVHTGGVTIENSTAILTAAGNSNTAGGIYVNEGEVTIEGSTIIATATASGAYAYGIYANSGAVSITDSTITASATSSSDNAYGIRAYNGNVTITGSIVTATASAGDDKTARGIHAYKGDVAISDSAVTANASGSDNDTYGILAGNTLSVTDNASVKASGSLMAVCAEGSAASVDIEKFTILASSNDGSTYEEEVSWNDSNETYQYDTTMATHLIITPINDTYIVSGDDIDADDYTEHADYLEISAAGTYNIAFTDGISATIKPIIVTAKGDVTLNFDDVKIGTAGIAIMTEDGDLTITGDLTIKGDLQAVSGGDTAIMTVDGNLTIADGTVYAVSAGGTAIYSTADITIEDGATVTAIGVASDKATSGISAISDIKINDSTVTAIASNTASNVGAYGINGNAITIDESTVTATATASKKAAYGIYVSNSNDISISDGSTVTATANASIDAAYGIYVNGGNATIDNSTVTATATASNDNAYGICVFGNGDISISGGSTVSVTITVTNVTETHTAYGISTQNGEINIEESTVTAATTAIASDAITLYAGNSMEISNATVTATANSSMNAYAIKSLKDLDISGGTVIATASGVASVYGLYASSGNISIKDTAAVTAQSIKSAESKELDGVDGTVASLHIAISAAGGDISIADTATVIAIGADYAVKATGKITAKTVYNFGTLAYDVDVSLTDDDTSYYYVVDDDTATPATNLLFAALPADELSELADTLEALDNIAALTASEIEDILAAVKLVANTDAAELADAGDDVIAALNKLDALYVEILESLTVTTAVDTADFADDEQIGTVDVSGLGIAVYGNGTYLVKNSTLTLQVAQIVADDAHFAFTATPWKQVGAAVARIPNGELHAPVTMLVYLPASFTYDHAMVEHVQEDGTSQMLDLSVQTDANDNRYLPITVTEFSSFYVTGYTVNDTSVRYTYYDITVEDSDNGTVTASATRAVEDKTVTITATPDDGYEIDAVLVLDEGDDELDLTDKGDGKYSFTMPDEDVTIEVTFVAIEGEADEQTAVVFLDVNPDAYYYNAVLWAVENGITNGMSETLFAPDTICTRAQAVTFLWNAAGQPTAFIENPFTDVSEDAWYYDAVLWAVSEGITNGMTDTTFAPNATCTRAQIVTFLWNAAGNPVVNYLMDFDDVAGDVWYAEAVRWAVSEGITTGMGDNQFAPTTDCTRAQIVTFLYRYW